MAYVLPNNANVPYTLSFVNMNATGTSLKVLLFDATSGTVVSSTSLTGGLNTISFNAAYSNLTFEIYESGIPVGTSIVEIDDITLTVPTGGTTQYFTGEVLSATDYYSFGATMPGRSFTSSNYRYGFNGKENDPETNTQDYGFRIYNPSLGKFLSVDPLTMEYPWFSPFQFAGNRPIDCIDLEGKEPYKDGYQFTSTDPKMALYNSSNVVDMSKTRTGTSYNSLGWPREKSYFWGEYQFTPVGRQALSPSNLEIIKKGGTPVVDEHWNSVMKQYGNDGIIGENIQHHHVNKGAMTIAVPQSKHTGKGYTVENHSMEPRVGKVHSTTGKYLRVAKTLNSVDGFLSITSMALNSPNSPIYFFHVPGTGNQNRAYPTNSEDGTMAPYYEWRLMEDKKTREVKYFDSYERKDGEWRGKGQVGETDYFDLDGNKTSKPSSEKVKD